MHLLTKNAPKDGIKLAPPIKQLSVLSYERHADQKLWYIIKVTPQQTDCTGQQQCFSGTTLSTTDSSRPPLQRKSYLIARRYEQFCHLDQQLRSEFSTSILSSIRSRRSSQQQLFGHSSPFSLSLSSGDNIDMNDLPKLSKLQRKILPSKPINNERQSELHRYCQELLRLPTQVTHSLLVLEFFGLHKPDTERIVFSSMACLSASRLSYVAPSSTPLQSPPSSTAPSSPSSHSAVPPSPLSPIVSRRSRSIVLDDDTEASHRLVKKAKSQPNFFSHSPIPLLPPSPPPLPPLLSTYDDIDIKYNHMGSSGQLPSMTWLANGYQPSPSHSSSSASASSSSSNSSIENDHYRPLTPSTSPAPPPPQLASTKETCGMISAGAPTLATHASSPFGTTGGTAHKSHKSQHGLDIRHHHRQHTTPPLTISTNVVTDTDTTPIDRVISPEIDLGDQDSDNGATDDGQDEEEDELMMMNCTTPTNMTYEILSLPPSAMTLASSTTRPSTSNDFYSSSNTSNSSDSLAYLKLKVVYDLDNIILLQVPRTIKLPELRARILHKFDDMATDLPVDFKLVFNSLAPGGRKDSLLSSSAAYSTYANLDARTIIGTQDDLVNAMSKWADLPKVSVRCVVN